ncbi:MAG: phosphoglycerate dehydrogenase [Acidobacteria bacterium]|nr:phosphoglycerate dehydrogenase [Acidobacteriota bacterium]
MKIVVAEKISRKGVDLLREEKSWKVVECEPARDKLIPELKDADALLIRSAVQCDAALLAAAPRLKVIGRAGIGVDNVDIEAATKKGVLVMNTPGGNSVSVAEHTLALMLSMARSVAQANESMHAGRWEKKLFEGSELRGKTLGLLGLGRIGVEVVKRARAFELDIIGYDPYISPTLAEDLHVELVSLDDLFARSDYLSLHTPLTPETDKIIGRENLKKMKKGARIVNCARGELVDEVALAEAIAAGQIAGAALDVFSAEPLKNSPLTELKQVALTPHIAGSTAEAQEIVGYRIAEQVRDYLKASVIQNAVNMPSLPAEEYRLLAPYLNLAERLGSLLAQIAPGAPASIEIRYSGKLSKMNTSLLRNSALMGLLNQILDEKANVVNSVSIAKARGIRVDESHAGRSASADTLRIAVKGHGAESSVEGAVLMGDEPRLLVLDNINVECPLSGNLIVMKNLDVPGVIGKTGTILGKRGINIANFSLGREKVTKTKSAKRSVGAVCVVQVDGQTPAAVIKELTKIPANTFARAVELPE